MFYQDFWRATRQAFACLREVRLRVSLPMALPIALFSVVYLPQAFLMVRDLRLVSALEVDPGSIIQAIEGLFHAPYYNMHNSFHSQFYGWTYFSLNFLLLLPVKAACALLGVEGMTAQIVTIRLLLFALGLASVLAFYSVARRLFNHAWFAFFAALLLVWSPITAKVYVFVHPESTGMVFSLLGIVCLLRFSEDAPRGAGWYGLGLTSLVLSALAKQIFFVTALPVLGLFVFFAARRQDMRLGTLPCFALFLAGAGVDHAVGPVPDVFYPSL